MNQQSVSNTYRNSECGALDGEWCAYGKGFTSGEMREV